LSAPSTQSVTVNYATANNTATAGNDYLATSGSLTFAPGVTSKTVTISVLGNTAVANNKTFFVNLSSATNATIADSQGVGTTVHDYVPTIAFNDASVAEGIPGSPPLISSVLLSAPSPQSVTVSYATANNTATAGSDYTGTSGSLTFAPGETSK